MFVQQISITVVSPSSFLIWENTLSSQIITTTDHDAPQPCTPSCLSTSVLSLSCLPCFSSRLGLIAIEQMETDIILFCICHNLFI